MFTTKKECENFIEYYLKKKSVTEATTKATINRVLAYEEKFQKFFYDFSEIEILSMYESIHSVSNRTIQNANLVLKEFANWLNSKSGRNLDNPYKKITKDKIDSCIDNRKKDSLILTLNDLRNIQQDLYNKTDAAILELLFWGISGEKLKELSFLDNSNLTTGILIVDNKATRLSQESYILIKQAFAESELRSYNNSNRFSSVQSLGIYKQRFNSKSNNSDYNNEGDIERRYRWIQRRLLLMSEYIGIELKSSTILYSGFLHILKQKLNQLGLSFRDYIKTDDCRELAKRYNINSDLYRQILVEKFEKHFT